MLLIVFIIIAIVIGLKLINTMDKIDRIVDNVDNKVNSLNGFFNIIDSTTLKISGIYNKLAELASKVVDKVFFSKKEREDEDYE